MQKRHAAKRRTHPRHGGEPQTAARRRSAEGVRRTPRSRRGTPGAPPYGGHRPAVAEPAQGREVCLLLRAHAEARWLDREVLPVVRQLETPCGLPEEEVDAALAYLQVAWTRARLLALRSDATRSRLGRGDAGADELVAAACRYHAATRRLREMLLPRVASLLGPIGSRSHGGQATHGRGWLRWH